MSKIQRQTNDIVTIVMISCLLGKKLLLRSGGTNVNCNSKTIVAIAYKSTVVRLTGRCEYGTSLAQTRTSSLSHTNRYLGGMNNTLQILLIWLFTTLYHKAKAHPQIYATCQYQLVVYYL